MSKRTKEDAGEEKVTAKSKPMMNLVSRCSIRDPNVLACTASESPGENQIWKSDTSELVEWAATKNGETCDGRSFIKLLRMKILTRSGLLKQEWKSGELLEARTARLVSEQPASSFTQHTDKFVTDGDDVDSNTTTESDFSLKSRSFLHRVNDRVRKMLDQSSKDATQDNNQHSLIWWMSSTLETSVLLGKNYSENFHSIKNTGNNLTLKHMFDIWKVDSRTIGWDFWSESN